MNRLLKVFNKVKKYPFGKQFFSYRVARTAPYFTTIKTKIEGLQPDFSKVTMPNRKTIHNHLGTIHAIALCNICEIGDGHVCGNLYSTTSALDSNGYGSRLLKKGYH